MTLLTFIHLIVGKRFPQAEPLIAKLSPSGFDFKLSASLNSTQNLQRFSVEFGEVAIKGTF